MGTEHLEAESLKNYPSSLKQNQLDDIPMNVIGGDNVEGDKIDIGEIGGQSTVAVGRGAKASIFNIDLRLLPLVFALIVVAGSLAYFLQRTFAKPEAMDPGFNVAVAEFMVEDEDGSQVNSGEGLSFSKWLYSFVKPDLDETLGEALGQPVNVWSPENTGPIIGENKADREEMAKTRAQEIGADVIIYGVLTQDGDESETAIEFYVNHNSFEEGQDIKGHHDLGSSLTISNPFEAGLDEIGNSPLTTRARSLSLLAVGLAYYSIDNFDKGIEYLEQADNDPDWWNDKEEGKHVVKMLLGNAYGRKSANTDDPSILPTAQAYYAESLEINDEYPRAMIGQASVEYNLALGDPKNPENKIDFEQLNRVEQGFETALEFKQDPDQANIQSKVDFGLGQVYLIRAIDDPNQWLEKAIMKYKSVTSEYENDNEDIKYIASHSYARLGIIEDVLHDNPHQAIIYYQQAAQIASPYFKGEYFGRLGDLYVQTCQIDLANDAYKDAYDAARQISEVEQAKEFRSKRNHLEDLDTC